MSGAKDAEIIAKQFHSVYEALAPQHGYKTRDESAVRWEDVPEPNRTLMVQTVRYLLAKQVIVPGPKR